MPDTETVATPTMQQAADMARDQLKSEETTPVETPAPEVNDTETANDDPTPVQEKETEATEQKETSDEQLLSDEDYNKLKKDPEALRKALNKAATKKFQKLSAERKELEKERERVKEYNDLITRFETNSEEAYKWLGERLGIKHPGEEARQETAVSNAANSAVDLLKDAFGPEGEILAERLGPVIQTIAKSIAEEYMSKEVKPLKEAQEAQRIEAIKAESNSEWKSFCKTHSDAPSFEKKMVDLGQRLQPAPGMDTQEYLDQLYYLASRDVTEADKTKQVVDRLNKSARSAQPTAEISSERVTPTAPKRPSFQEAFQAAKRNERWG
jgi:hypothetical protein